MSTFETTSPSSRATNNNLSRIVVRLASIDGEALSSDGAIKLTTALHSKMKGRDAKHDSKVVFGQGEYLVDFAIRDGETPETALPRVVADADGGLLGSQLPAKIEEARLAPANLLDFGRVSIEAWQGLPELDDARELFESHHSQALEAELTRFFFDADVA